ncbi:MAG TPA: DUF3048 domain-containing protein [Mycobacteriales bacterium]|nr:DUF3048 domain-containing protein [Mycobacteriales bacterium]
MAAEPSTAISSSAPAAQIKAQPPAGPICPLTGLPPRKDQDVSRPPLGVKIDNVVGALPQAGINSTDIVVEELVEGGLTRLMAIFQCSSAGKVGPIRSARISDADILALLHGSVLGFSGANPRDLPPIEAHGDAALVSQDNDPQYFYRSDVHEAPHNVFSSTKQLVKAGLARRRHLKAPKPLFSYGAIDPAAKKAHHVSLTWPAATALWKWSHNRWLRTQNGSTDKLLDGSQLNTTNVVVMGVNIASTGLRDVLGNASPEDVTVGHNPLWVFRNGKVITGTWKRRKIGSRLQLLDHKGHVIRLAAGRTWLELLPRPAKPSF